MKTKILYFISIFLLFIFSGNQIAFANDDMTSTGFIVNLGKLFGGLKSILTGTDTGSQFNSLFDEIYTLLLGGIGVFTLFVMVIGTGYMITNLGNEEKLNKGKKMFKYGLVGLILALSAYYIMTLISHLIYG